MNNAVLIQQIYPNTPGVKMLELTRMHHQAYCDKFAMDYWCEISNPLPSYDVMLGSWGKIELIRRALDTQYQSVVWLDADTLIVDLQTNLRDAIQPDKIGACWHRIPQLNHWNVGALYIDNTPNTRAFIDEWLASYPPKPQWLEQGEFNRLARESRTVVTISDKWNATLDVSMVPDAVVLGFHGQSNTEYRYNLMQKTMDQLFPTQKAAPREVREVVQV